MKKLKKSIYVTVAIASLIIFSNSLSYSQCETQNKILIDMQKELESNLKIIEDEGNKLSNQIENDDEIKGPNLGSHNMKFDVTFNEKKMSFDLIEITMKNNVIKFDVPQATMKRKTISIPGTTIRWKVKKLCCGIKTKIPEVVTYMQKKHFDLPEFKMNTTSIVTKIPEFKKETKQIIMHIPEFKLVSPIPEEGSIPNQEKIDTYTKQAQLLSELAVDMEKEQKGKIRIAIDDLFGCMESNIQTLIIEQKASKELLIKDIDSSIKSITDNGLNPNSIKTDDGLIVDLYEEKMKNTRIFDEIINDLEATLNKLKEDHKTTIEGLI